MLKPGQVLCDRYQLNQLLGQAPGRQTWLATDQAATTPESVVVKLLAFGDTMQWVDLKLFEREAQVLYQLRHAYMPHYRDSFTLEDRLHWFGLVQDYIPGRSLKQCLDQGQHFSERQILDIATNILHLLTYLHGLSPPVLHRDIKPSNLILGEDGYVYLIDFGAVQDRAAVEGASFTVVGSYGYTPMEQFGGRAVPASDLYALGATLIHLLTGVAPADLPQEDLKIQFADRVSVNSGLVCWIQYLTEPDVKKWLQTAQAALADLQQGQTAPLQPFHSRTASPKPSLPKGSFAALAAAPPADSPIKVGGANGSLTLQISNVASDGLIICGLATMFFGGILAVSSILLGGEDLFVLTLPSCVVLLLTMWGCWANLQITAEFDHENFWVYKTIFGQRFLIHRGRVCNVVDVYYHGEASLWSVVLQTRNRQSKELGASLRHGEARWLVALMRAWLVEHRQGIKGVHAGVSSEMERTHDGAL